MLLYNTIMLDALVVIAMLGCIGLVVAWTLSIREFFLDWKRSRSARKKIADFKPH